MLRSMINGATVMACLACAVFFLRFWRQSRDRLFAFFALAFTVMAVNWTLLTVMDNMDERRHYVYLIRLAAFSLILFAIWDKNRGGPRGGT